MPPQSPHPEPERFPENPGTDGKRFKEALKLALSVAAQGEIEDPPVKAPNALRPLLTHQKLTHASYVTIARVIENDPGFRQRVGDSADEAKIGRADFLWLTRPKGWLDDPSFWEGTGGSRSPEALGATSGSDKPASKREIVKAVKEAVADARAKNRDLDKEIKALRLESKQLRTELSASEELLRVKSAEAEQLEVLRSDAMRHAKDLEKELAEARHRLKSVKAAALAAEEELLEERQRGGSSPNVDTSSYESDIKLALEQAEEIEAVSRLARELAERLGAFASGQGRSDQEPESNPVLSPRSTRSKRPRRRLPRLAPGSFDGTVEANKFWLSDAANLVLVDGYNVARRRWSALSLTEERERVVKTFEDLSDRYRTTVTVVFDGDHSVVSPTLSRKIRVQYSDQGQTADEVIGALIEASSPSQPIVVISSDNEVIAHARSYGAGVLSVEAFFEAVSR